MKITTRANILLALLAAIFIGGFIGVFHLWIIPWNIQFMEQRGWGMVHSLQSLLPLLDQQEQQELLQRMGSIHSEVLYMVLFNKDGQVVADNGPDAGIHPVDQEKITFVRNRYSTERLKMLAVPSPVTSSGSVKAIDLLVPYYNEGDYAGAINLGLSLSKIDKLHSQYNFLLAMIALGILALFFLFNWYLSRGIIVPIRNLALATREQESGYIRTLADERHDEIGILAREFDIMTGQTDLLLTDLQKREKDLQDYIDQLLTYNCKVDRDGSILMANAVLAGSFNVSPSQMAGEKLWVYVADVFGSEAGAQMKALIETAARSETVCSQELSWFRDGRWISLDVGIRPVLNDKEALVYLVCEANDISDRKEAEEKLRSAHDQLEQRVRERTMELEKTNEKLKAQIMEKRRVEQALLESEKRLQNRVEYLNTLLSNLNEIFFVYGKDGNITFLNNKACEVLGYEPGEMIGRHASLLVPYPNRKRVCEEINRRIELGTANSYEVPLRCKDGSERLARINSSPIVENGEITGGMALGEDITGYRQTEEALRISEKKFSTAFRLSPDMLSIISATGKYMEVNDSWLEHTGYSRDEVIGQNPVEMGIWFDMTNIRSIARELLDSGIAMNMEASFKTKSGEVRKVLTSLAQISFNDEYYTIVQSHDITERKMMQDDLAREKERLQATLKSIGDGVIATDHRGRIIVVNEAAESILGIEHNEMIGQQLENVMNELIIDSPDEETTQVSRAMPLNLSIHTAHGEERLIEASLAPMSSREGDYTGVVWAIRDVTDRQRMEEEILKSSKLESLGVLAGGIAHDFNNLLTVVVGNLALSKMVLEENDEVIEYLTEAEKASFQAKGLTQQLLTFARGGAPIKKTRQLHSLIHDSVNLALSGSNVLGEFIIQDDLWPVDIDEGQMHQVINNLVINAVQAMPGGGKINIRACNINLSPDEIPPLPAGRYICIAVQDFGAGIPDELRSRIFDPYFTTKTMGSGLGLATSYSIIRKHDGHITVHSEPGRGSTFYVYLPASMRVIESNADGAGAIIPGRGRILLLDDDERIRDVAGQILDSIGYSAGLAKNGREVLEMYQQAMNRGEKYDMVIIDLTIPGEMGGKETARDLLRLDPEVKMVVSSGYSNDPVMAQYQEWGFQGVIAKPYGIKELSEVISSILNN